MDNPFQALLFAEDLIFYILHGAGQIWSMDNGVMKFRHLLKTTFMPHIGEAVMLIIQENIATIRSSYDKLLQGGITSTRDFSVEATITTIYFFKNGYNHLQFLKICASLVGLGVFYYVDGYQDIVKVVAQLLTYIVNFYIYHRKFIPNKSWFDLACTAQDVRRNVAEYGRVDGSPNTKDNLKA